MSKFSQFLDVENIILHILIKYFGMSSGDIYGHEEVEEQEPIPCDLCVQEGSLSSNVATRDCAKYEVDIDERLPPQPGRICDSCCESEFLDDPDGCFSSCYDQKAIRENLSRLFEKVFDLKDLEKTNFRKAEAFLNRDRTYLISPDLTEAIRELNPKPTTDSLEEHVSNMFYVKGRNGKIWSYSMELFKDVNKRFNPLSSSIPHELLCTEDGLLFVLWNYGPLQIGAAIAPIKDTFMPSRSMLVEELEQKLEEVRRFFGVTGHRPELQSYGEMVVKLDSLGEDQVIEKVVIPLLWKLGYQNVRRVEHHGPGEAGVDIGPFYRKNVLGFSEFFVAQVKAKGIHAVAKKSDGNVNEVIRQIEEALRTPRECQGQEVRINGVYLICSKEITPDAKAQLTHAFRERPNVMFIDRSYLIELIVRNNICLD